MAGERTAPDVQRMGLQAEKIWREAERRIMEDVIRRIKKAGEITSTADYQINRLKILSHEQKLFARMCQHKSISGT